MSRALHANTPPTKARRPLTILLVKPKARLATIHALQRFQLLEPLELGYLAAVVPAEHRVSVLDLRFARHPADALRRQIRELAPDIVGLTGYSHEGSIVKELARHARAAAPRALIVVGGHHASVAADDYNIPEIDLIVRGEGCLPFRRIVEATARGEAVEGVEGVVATGGQLDPAALAPGRGFPRRRSCRSRGATSGTTAATPAPGCASRGRPGRRTSRPPRWCAARSAAA